MVARSCGGGEVPVDAVAAVGEGVEGGEGEGVGVGGGGEGVGAGGGGGKDFVGGLGVGGEGGILRGSVATAAAALDLAEVGGEDERALHEGAAAGVVGEWLEAQGAGEGDGEGVGCPVAFEFEVSAGRGKVGEGLAVEGDGVIAGGPRRAAEVEGEFARGVGFDGEGGGLFFGEIGLHGEVGGEEFGAGVGGGEEVDVEVGGGVVVKAFAVQGVVFESGAAAAGHAQESLVFVGDAGAHGDHVTELAVVEADGGEDVVEEGAFVERGELLIGVECEEEACEFEHVVDVAGFGGAEVSGAVVGAVDFIGELVGGVEVFIVAVAAGGEGVVVDDGVPEEFSGVTVGRVAGVDVADEFAEELGDLGVAVLTAEDVVLSGEWIDDGLVAEFLGEGEPAFIAGVGVEVGEGFVDAAEFAGEHLLELVLGEWGEEGVCPGGEFGGDVEGLGVAGAAVGVAEAREEFVLDVPGRPHAVEIEGGGADVAC